MITDSPLIDAFLDGSTGAGLFEKLSPPGRPDQFKAVLRAGICGFAAAIAMLFGIVFLAMRNHDAWACGLCVVQNTQDMIAKGRKVSTGHKGEQNARAILTVDLVKHIRQSRLMGETCKSIGARLGVDYRTISYAATGASWSHVEGAIPKGYKNNVVTDTSTTYQHQASSTIMLTHI